MRVCLAVLWVAVFTSACTTSHVVAQAPLDFVRSMYPFEIRGLDGNAHAYPFAGGFVQPRPQLVDLDNDGDADLVVSEGGRGLAYYENEGDGAPGHGFSWRTDGMDGIAPGSWFRMGDLDGDGDYDLLTQGEPGRVRYYRNTGTTENAEFTLAADGLMQSNGTDPVTNEDTSIPALADLDNDGDPDFFHGQADRGHITYFRNDGVSNGLPQFTFVTVDFEGIEVFEDNPTCDDPVGGGRGSLHGANALTFVDLDDDGDFELFWGDFFARSLFFFNNTGSANNPQYELISEVFPLDEPLTSGGYNTSFFGDVNADGDNDLVIGILGGLCSNIQSKFDNLFFYENVGTASDDQFSLRSERLIEGVDHGERAVPTLADVDGDGDLDMVIGNDPLGILGSQLSYYENQGTATVASFQLTDPDWLSLEYDFGAYAPVFADLDNDADLDLVVGGFNGRLAFLRNTGSSTNPTYVLEDERFQNIDVGQYIRLSFGDVDADGDLDLLTGESNGLLKIYRNVGSAEVPAFETESNGSPVAADLAYRDAIGLGVDIGFDSAPRFVDIDGDADLDVLTGSETGPIRFFRNTGSAATANFVEEESIVAYRTTTVPAFADLDDDDDLDMVVGNRSGGLLYYRNEAIHVGVNPPPEIPSDRAMNLRAEPNPSGGRVLFRFDSDAPPDAEIAVFDSRGRSVTRLPVTSLERVVEWDGRIGTASGISSGVYVARLVAQDQVLAATTFTHIR